LCSILLYVADNKICLNKKIKCEEIYFYSFFNNETNSVQKPDRHKIVKTDQVAKI